MSTSAAVARFTHPVGSGFAITPNDDTDLPASPRGIYIGGAGNVSAILAEDSTPVTFVGLAPGVVHPIRVKRVRATGTTATGILGLY